jgi:hypothetical protein
VAVVDVYYLVFVFPAHGAIGRLIVTEPVERFLELQLAFEF